MGGSCSKLKANCTRKIKELKNTGVDSKVIEEIMNIHNIAKDSERIQLAPSKKRNFLDPINRYIKIGKDEKLRDSILGDFCYENLGNLRTIREQVKNRLFTINITRIDD